jgi:S1-C subfamily serine protease
LTKREALQARYERGRARMGLPSESDAKLGSGRPRRPRRGLLPVIIIAGIVILAAVFLWIRSGRLDTGTGLNAEGLAMQGTGSGFFICDSGWFVTAAHVVSDAAQIRLVVAGDVFPARLVRMDPANDIALLKAEGEFRGLPLRLDDQARLGDSVFTVGFPMPGIQGQSPKLTRGDVGSIAGMLDDPRHFQISVPVQPGNSGGPLCAADGSVTGVIVSRLDDIRAYEISGSLPQNVNYALKIAYLTPLLAPTPGAVNLQSSAPDTSVSIVENVEKSVALVVALGEPSPAPSRNSARQE